MTLDNRALAEIAGTSTVVALALARHLLAPKHDSTYYRVIFDTVQDLAKNNDRIGEVRPIATPPAQPAAKEETTA